MYLFVILILVIFKILVSKGLFFFLGDLLSFFVNIFLSIFIFYWDGSEALGFVFFFF